MMQFEEISKGLIAGKAEEVRLLTIEALEDGLAPESILSEALIAGMSIVGNRFKKHEIFLPDVLLAAKAMQSAMDLLAPYLAGAEMPLIGRVVLGTVQGDLHDIGKNLVGVLLEGAGFEVIDLGNDVAPSRFVEIAIEQDASVIAMSALLTTTMPVMSEVTRIVHDQGLQSKIRTIVGGAPLSKEIAHQLGADSYGFDAANAVERITELVADANS